MFVLRTEHATPFTWHFHPVLFVLRPATHYGKYSKLQTYTGEANLR
jgi:hypothetical protein